MLPLSDRWKAGRQRSGVARTRAKTAASHREEGARSSERKREARGKAGRPRTCMTASVDAEIERVQAGGMWLARRRPALAVLVAAAVLAAADVVGADEILGTGGAKDEVVVKMDTGAGKSKKGKNYKV